MEEEAGAAATEIGMAGDRRHRKKLEPADPETPRPRRRPPAIVLAIAVLVPLLNAIPTLDGYMEERPPARVFLGFRHMAGDHFQYGSFVRQASDEGRFFLENRFTTEPQRPSYVFLYFWAVGIICRVTGLGLPAVWEITRLLAGASFLIGCWWFTGLLFRGERERLLAYVLIAFSGGIGWIAALLPPETLARPGLPGLTDPFNFQWNWSTFGSMLIPLWLVPSAILLAAALLLTREPPLKPQARWAAGAVLPPLIWFTHPHTGNAAYLTFGLYALAPLASAMWRVDTIDWSKVRHRVVVTLPFLLSFGIVAAYLRWAMLDPVFKENSRHGFDWNPAYSVFWYPVTYGLLGVLALFGMRWSASLDERPRHLLFAWLASSLVLSTNPLYAGVKYQYLLHLPLALFAAHGLIELRRRSARVLALSRGIGAVAFGAVLFLNAPLSLVKDFPKTAADREIYLSQAEIDAARFLDAQPQGGVLCAFRSGNFLAWLARKKVFEGHWLLTVDSGTKERELQGFFSSSVAADLKRSFLNQRGLRYVYYGPIERQLGAVDPAIGLESIYDREGIAIYRAP